MVLALLGHSGFVTKRVIVDRVCGVVREVSDVGGNVEVTPSLVLSHLVDCSLARVSLQLAVEREFKFLLNSSPQFVLIPGKTTVTDLTLFAWAKIVKRYSDEDLYRLIALCFRRQGGFTEERIEGLGITSRPLTDSLGPLDEVAWSEWRLEMGLFLPVRIPERFCRETPLGIWYFLRHEIESLI